MQKNSYNYEELISCGKGSLFGEGNAKLPLPPMLMFDRITEIKKDIGMTGEITLRGRVLPIGGLKEKVLAAKRSGLKQVLIPIDNKKDLADIPDNIKQGIEIITVSFIEEVISHALVKKPKPFLELKSPISSQIETDSISDVTHTH